MARYRINQTYFRLFFGDFAQVYFNTMDKHDMA